MGRINGNQMRGLRDYNGQLHARVAPSTGAFPNAGPANSPIDQAPQQATLNDVVKELQAQNLSRIPILRSRNIDSVGETLDWSNIGLMDRFLMRNKGPDSVWVAFDVNGPAVDAFTSDLSFELQAQESLNIPLCQFYKIGCKTASAGKLGLIHAVAFQATAGDLGASIS